MSVLKVGAIQPNSGTKVNITGSTLLVTTASGHFSGSYEGDGSRLEGVAGFPFTGSGQISGSLLVTGSSTLALRVSGSSAFTGSLFVSGTLSGSFSGSGASLTGIVSSSTAVLAQTASVATRANGLAPTVTASFADISTLARAGSGSFSGSYQGDGSLLTGVVASGSIQSASVAVRATTLSPAATASFADKADEAVTSIVIPVTVVDDGGNKYAFNGVTTPKLSLKRGSRYRFDLSDSTNGSHPFGFRLPDDTSYTVESRVSEMMQLLQEGELNTINIIVKADTNGSVEAIKDSLLKLSDGDVSIQIVHAAVGGIVLSDVDLASATGSMIVGFNVRPDSQARNMGQSKGIDIRTYNIIYELIDDISEAVIGELTLRTEESVIGMVDVKTTFKAPKVGVVAGSVVSEGRVELGAKAGLLRDGVVIYEGSIVSLRRFKDDVESVNEGLECGIGLSDYKDIKQGDVIEILGEVAV